jgi:hypothetical protein
MDDNEIECTNCGASIPLDLTRCPHCGMNLYPEDEDGEYTPRRAGADELWPGARVRIGKAPPQGAGTLQRFFTSIIARIRNTLKR